MTLIVAAATPDIAFMVGDTLLTSPFQLKDAPQGPVGGQFHALKIHIIDPHVVIGFSSNNVEVATEIIAALKDDLYKNPTIDVGKRIFEIYKVRIEQAGIGGAPDCDFLVLTKNTNGNHLSYVSRNDVSVRERAYIGDATAYQAIQTLRKPRNAITSWCVQQTDGSFKEEPYEASAGEIEFDEVARAMESLVEKRLDGVGAIGGNVVRVVDAILSGEFEYLQSGLRGISPFEGQYGYTLLASNAKVRGIGIFFERGCVGFILVGGDREYCRREKAKSIQEFIKLAAEKYGMNLVGVT